MVVGLRLRWWRRDVVCSRRRLVLLRNAGDFSGLGILELGVVAVALRVWLLRQSRDLASYDAAVDVVVIIRAVGVWLRRGV